MFRHNQEAYETALVMLAETGRAAVIHPTGTGKSFIGFRLCEDFPDKRICWLSPSEYIFRTQLENWRAASETEEDKTADQMTDNAACSILGDALNNAQDNAIDEDADSDCLANIRFYTYARLMMMDAEELAQIRSDYIVLDEFHRCGARMWGQGVQRLLEYYPNIPVLGLSATNIRYLDGQRDMADELFDGNIASEMTLGDAIVRGILNPPKYVLSMYSCQKELERYRDRAKNAKSKAVRAEAEKYLEALRRALEKADGLDEIFYKHMVKEEIGCKGQEEHKISDDIGLSGHIANFEQSREDGQSPGDLAQHDGNRQAQTQMDRASGRYGKYLVFCASYEHMQEMIAKVPEWFAKVDPEPHVYSVYSEDAQAEAEFARFKADGSNHLKLLFCIDMLNEGIHVDDVSGVILLRPTISPIIYKQQIGRALSAGRKQGENAIIFDVVMNIENLYSIGTVEEEMQAAVRYYRDHGESELIVNEHFHITDEMQDCMKLFRKLNETLGASWELMYQAAAQYFETHGDLEATKRYVTEDGLSLGQWLDTQRKVRAGKVKGVLTEEQIARLDKLGMRWESKTDRNWERNFAAAQAYYREHGDLLVNVQAETYDGVKLGKWLAQLRTYKKSGIRANYLTQERIEALDLIGMIWDVPDYLWEQNYHAAMRYHREHGNLDVPYYYVDSDGVKLGVWIANIRFARKNERTGRAELSREQIARLDELGMIWENKHNTVWERSYAAACRYRKKYGNLNIPVAYVTEDGLHLGRWVRSQRNIYINNHNMERKKKLEAIGIDVGNN